MENTRDLLKFGYREREIAAQLLNALGSSYDKTNYLDENVTVEFNPNSGYVFLVDENYNVAMMNGKYLEDFISCPECGNESIASEFKNECNSECCQEYANDIEL